MARIDLSGIRHAYGPDPREPADYALRQVDHVFDDGGAYALLGPSGCGKTTLLNLISGLVVPSEGKILFDGVDVTGLSTEKRNIAQVFQFPVIYDTMTVRQNLAFPLHNRKVKRADVRRRVDEVLEIIGLQNKAERRARGLTADEKQKISLGRGLVRSDVAAILFDEPLTVIDPLMKWELRAQLKEMHRRFGYTMIYVTHDQTEALNFADKVVVMYDGEIVQIGSPADLFERPRHTFVGYFIGSPGMNVMPVTVDGTQVHLGSHAIELGWSPGPAGDAKIELGVRPEFVRVGAVGMPATVTRVEDAGRMKIVRMLVEGLAVTAVLQEGADIPAAPRVTFDPRGINLYANSWRVETGDLIAPPAPVVIGPEPVIETELEPAVAKAVAVEAEVIAPEPFAITSVTAPMAVVADIATPMPGPIVEPAVITAEAVAALLVAGHEAEVPTALPDSSQAPSFVDIVPEAEAAPAKTVDAGAGGDAA
jgi:glycerol transport system ATP-binding protein